MHEVFARETKTQGSSDRSFGLTMAAFFALVGFAPLRHGTMAGVRWWLVALAVAFPASAMLWTVPLRPLNRLWFKLGLLLSKVVNPIVLAVLYYGFVTPFGLVMRLTGKDALGQHPDPGAASYWVVREPGQPTPDSMKRQF